MPNGISWRTMQRARSWLFPRCGTATATEVLRPWRPVAVAAHDDLVEVDRNGLEVLGRDACLRLLATATLGRLAVSVDALPTVLPVNFRFDGRRILIRTGAGTKLDAAANDAVVAFEVDEIDPVAHTGWSVVVTGIARELTDAGEVMAAQTPPLARWAPGDDHRVIAISTELVSGRRIVAGLTASADADGR